MSCLLLQTHTLTHKYTHTLSFFLCLSLPLLLSLALCLSLSLRNLSPFSRLRAHRLMFALFEPRRERHTHTYREKERKERERKRGRGGESERARDEDKETRAHSLRFVLSLSFCLSHTRTLSIISLPFLLSAHQLILALCRLSSLL